MKKLALPIFEVYLTKKEFDRDLDTCLLILKEPTKRKPFYTCQMTGTLDYKIVNVFVK